MTLGMNVSIKASPERVFAIMTDFASYPEWNPWLIEATGECKPGAKVVVNARVGGKFAYYCHSILAVEKPLLFHWCDEGWFTVFAKGERIRRLRASAEGTEYEVELRIRGIFSRLAYLLFGKSLQEGILQETLALKAYAEMKPRE